MSTQTVTPIGNAFVSDPLNIMAKLGVKVTIALKVYTPNLQLIPAGLEWLYAFELF